MGAPVKLTWSREDDMQQDLLPPGVLQRGSPAALDADGWPVACTSRIACPPFGGIRNGLSRTGVEGIADMPYAIPNMLVDYHAVDPGIPVSYWRSVGYSQNTFFAESFLDELAAAGGKDPVEVRRRLLAKSPRLLGVLELAAEKAGWGKAAAGGARARRVAGQQHRQLHGAGGRGLGRARQAASASRGLRGGLRPRGESRRSWSSRSRAASCSAWRRR